MYLFTTGPKFPINITKLHYGHNVFQRNGFIVFMLTMSKQMPPVTAPLFVFCFSVIFAYVCYTKNVINVTSIGRQISELMFLWWPAILYSVLNSVCLLMANKWMMMMNYTFLAQLWLWKFNRCHVIPFYDPFSAIDEDMQLH